MTARVLAYLAVFPAKCLPGLVGLALYAALLAVA